MPFVKPLAVVSLAFAAVAAQAQDSGPLLTMQIEKDGLVIAKPRWITKLDTPTRIEFQAAGEPRYRVSVVAANHAMGRPLPVVPQ